MKPEGYFLLKEPHWSFSPGAWPNPVAPKGSLLSFFGVSERGGHNAAPYCELTPNKGDYLFLVRSPGEAFEFEVPLAPNEIESLVEPVEIETPQWFGDTGNQAITIRWGTSNREEFFPTQASLAARLNGILKNKGVLLPSALVWCLQLPEADTQDRFYPKGSRLEGY